MDTDIRNHAVKRSKYCRVASRSFEIWLSALTPANVFLVGGAGVLSLAAGAEILLKTGIITVETAGIMALTSAAFTVVHNRLRCDPHQAECRRLHNEYKSMATKYESLAIESDTETLKQRVFELDSNLSQLQTTATASPAKWCERKATAEASI